MPERQRLGRPVYHEWSQRRHVTEGFDVPEHHLRLLARRGANEHENSKDKSTITVRVGPGDYDFPESYTISGAMRIENSNPQAGPVTLR